MLLVFTGPVFADSVGSLTASGSVTEAVSSVVKPREICPQIKVSRFDGGDNGNVPDISLLLDELDFISSCREWFYLCHQVSRKVISEYTFNDTRKQDRKFMRASHSLLAKRISLKNMQLHGRT